MIRIEECSSQQQWDSEVLDRGGHPLQLWGWGEVKAHGNWKVERVFVLEDTHRIGMAQILSRKLPWPLKHLSYIPRGPIADPDKRAGVLMALAGHVKEKHGAVSLMVEPDWDEVPQLAGWRQSPNPILLARTLILDLSKSEEELLSQMTKKTRQYIRKSEGEGIEIKLAKTLDDVDACLAIYKETASRAGFALHKDEYYKDIFTSLGSNSQIFMAKHKGELVAFLWLVASEETAFELYGGMNDKGQELRANYILKWTTIRAMKKWGIAKYDMNGLLNDGVSKFKQGFATYETMLAGSYEKPLSPLYVIWANALPAVKNLLRRFK